jgi:acyl-[acyl-carrier-protein] desaturase
LGFACIDARFSKSIVQSFSVNGREDSGFFHRTPVAQMNTNFYIKRHPFHGKNPARSFPGRCSAAKHEGPTLVRTKQKLNDQQELMHTATLEQLECIESIQEHFGDHILPLLGPVQEMWQPSDLLPEPQDTELFLEQVRDLRERAADIPDDLLLCLIGDMVTEEALPTYMAMLNTLDGVRDETGQSMGPYARWTRKWIAEENRHGDLLNKYLWMTGRVNMKAVEQTIQYLIGQGMNPGTENNPYHCFIFTSFQERATKVSHGGTARISKSKGDDVLAKICGVIAADESRHEMAYTRLVSQIFAKDPNGAIGSFATMMRKKIVMPAHLMDDGSHSILNGSKRDLFEDFSSVAEDLGVYTAFDYIKIMQHLIDRWNIANLQGLNEQGVKDQEYLLSLPDRFLKLAERKKVRKASAVREKVLFSWISNRSIVVL